MPSTATVVRRVFITAAICRPIVITALSNPSYDCIARATPRASHHHLRLQPPPPPQSPPTYLCSCQSAPAPAPEPASAPASAPAPVQQQ
uniref:Uncharacterized protein n=1 Tax=Vespula pensylvanica TaxID=30213 RepID=A0A834UDY3_VESPE|nr:hypothetical protein H0235_002600 [Vespula pensylvanica]